MEFQQVVERRRMVRNYADRPVDPGAIARALRNATRAPSAGFSQGWAFVVLEERTDIRRYWRATTDAEQLERPDAWLAGMMRAPVIVIPCSSKDAYLDRYAEPDKGVTNRDEARWRMPYWHLDTAMASLLILQTVVDEGLGALFFGIPTDRIDAVRREFGIPDTHDPIGAITIGHLADDAGVSGSPAHRRRIPLDELVHRGGWTR
jgi:nitroreductase